MHGSCRSTAELSVQRISHDKLCLQKQTSTVDYTLPSIKKMTMILNKHKIKEGHDGIKVITCTSYITCECGKEPSGSKKCGEFLD